MNAAFVAWVLLRFSRWALVIATVLYSIEFVTNREQHINSYQHLMPMTEFWMFSLPVAAVVCGLFEIMMREKGNIPRPAVARNWLG